MRPNHFLYSKNKINICDNEINNSAFHALLNDLKQQFYAFFIIHYTINSNVHFNSISPHSICNLCQHALVYGKITLMTWPSITNQESRILYTKIYFLNTPLTNLFYFFNAANWTHYIHNVLLEIPSKPFPILT